MIEEVKKHAPGETVRLYTEADVSAAVQAEREACARIVEQWTRTASCGEVHPQCDVLCSSSGHEVPFDGAAKVANAIRSRGPAPAVDVLGVVREYVESYDIVMDNIVHCRVKNHEHSALVARHKKALDALRSLVDGAAAKDEGGK